MTVRKSGIEASAGTVRAPFRGVSGDGDGGLAVAVDGRHEEHGPASGRKAKRGCGGAGGIAPCDLMEAIARAISKDGPTAGLREEIERDAPAKVDAGEVQNSDRAQPLDVLRPEEESGSLCVRLAHV